MKYIVLGFWLKYIVLGFWGLVKPGDKILRIISTWAVIKTFSGDEILWTEKFWMVKEWGWIWVFNYPEGTRGYICKNDKGEHNIIYINKRETYKWEWLAVLNPTGKSKKIKTVKWQIPADSVRKVGSQTDPLSMLKCQSALFHTCLMVKRRKVYLCAKYSEVLQVFWGTTSHPGGKFQGKETRK